MEAAYTCKATSSTLIYLSGQRNYVLTLSNFLSREVNEGAINSIGVWHVAIRGWPFSDKLENYKLVILYPQSYAITLSLVSANLFNSDSEHESIARLEHLDGILMGYVQQALSIHLQNLITNLSPLHMYVQ